MNNGGREKEKERDRTRDKNKSRSHIKNHVRVLQISIMYYEKKF